MENPSGSKKPMGAVIPITVSSFQALRAVLELATLAGANAALYMD